MVISLTKYVLGLQKKNRSYRSNAFNNHIYRKILNLYEYTISHVHGTNEEKKIILTCAVRDDAYLTHKIYYTCGTHTFRYNNIMFNMQIK